MRPCTRCLNHRLAGEFFVRPIVQMRKLRLGRRAQLFPEAPQLWGSGADRARWPDFMAPRGAVWPLEDMQFMRFTAVCLASTQPSVWPDECSANPGTER